MPYDEVDFEAASRLSESKLESHSPNPTETGVAEVLAIVRRWKERLSTPEHSATTDNTRFDAVFAEEQAAKVRNMIIFSSHKCF